MKKRNIVVLLAVLSLGLFACGENKPTPTDPTDQGGEVTPPEGGGEGEGQGGEGEGGGEVTPTVYHTVTFSVIFL